MKSSRRAQSSSSSVSSNNSSTVTYTFLNEHSNSPKSQSKTTSEIPIHSPSVDPTPIAVHLPVKKQEDLAALRIQSAYRSYIVRALVKKISAVNSETSYWESLIQRQVCCFSYLFFNLFVTTFSRFSGDSQFSFSKLRVYFL